MFTTRSVIDNIVSLIMLMVLWQSVSAAESISDSELARLCGGCPFYNPYCGRHGNNCPEFTECEGCEKCRFCIIKIGQKCFDYWAWWPDWDKCKDGTKPCENRPWVPKPGDPTFPDADPAPDVFGECIEGICVAEYPDPSYTYPDCSEGNYNWCDD